ncbi:MAG: hypothetical protein H7X70_00230 [Candidatus Kapabacteria bacterium]|nr:hypothetical protein [Candidatus Kapabacteria bacterium]
MSRGPSEDLHALIHALTQAEKRYVKIELRKHVVGDVNQSELLFDALAGQVHIDEAGIKKRFSKYGFAKRLPEAKRELMLVILRAMRQFHAERSSTRRAMSALQDGDFLRLRSQFRWADRRLKEALDDATLVHNHALRVMVLQSRAGLERATEHLPDLNSSPADDPIVREAELLVETAFFDAIVDRIHAIIRLYGRGGGPVAEALSSDLVKFGESRFPIITPSAQSAWLRFLSLKAFFVDNDSETSLRYDKSRLDMIERDEKFRLANLSEWGNLVHSVALRLVLTRDFSSARPLRDKLHKHWQEGTRQLSPASRMVVASQYLNVEVQMALQSNDFEELAPRIPVLDEVLTQHEHDTLTEMGIALLFNIALIEIGLGRIRDAMKRLTRTDDYPVHVREDIQTASRLMRILLHIDLENESVVMSLVRKERRNRKGIGTDLDVDILLSTASRYFTTAPGKARMKLLREALARVEDHYPTIAQPVTAIFEFRAWLNAKLNRTSWRAELHRTLS